MVKYSIEDADALVSVDEKFGKVCLYIYFNSRNSPFHLIRIRPLIRGNR